MKRTALLFLFIMLFIRGYSQTDNWYFSFSMGGSFPMSPFNQTKTDDSSSGYAQKGFSILLDATYPLSNHWGFKGSVLINTNSLNNDKVGQMLKNRTNSNVLITDPKYYSFTTNDWMQNAFLFGPVFTVNLGRFYWDLQLLGGLNLTYLPQQKLLYNAYNNDQTNPQRWYYQDKNTTSTDLAWGILGGTAFRFPISEHLNLKLGVDYYLSSARIKYEQTRVSQQADAVVTETLGSGTNTIQIRMITGTIGFVYYLN